MSKKGMGELLVRKQLINVDQLEAVKREQAQSGESFASVVVKLGYLKDAELAGFLSDQHNVPAIDLDSFEIDPEVIKTVPRETCAKHLVFPVSKAGSTLVVAFADPTNLYVRDDLQFITRCKIEVMVSTETAIRRAIDRYYDTKEELGTVMAQIEQEEDRARDLIDNVTHIDDKSSDSANIKFVNMILSEAIRLKASDIHIEPYEKALRVRFRVDGALIEKVKPPKALSDALASRVKIMANLDIAERRRPQDGRIRVKTKDNSYIDFRVNVLPVVHGEKIVMRILDKTNLKLDLRDLGFEQHDLQIFLETIKQPQGLVLVTGPTGSGKTTTLYSALAELNDPKKNLSTAEDPVEFNIEGINQVHVNPKIGFTFAAALRAFLRQDPDIILVGEIRDTETAEVAFKAASTGHLVLSTLHTNDAPSTIVRLLDMGMPSYLVTATTSLVLAQRLVMTICENCKVPHKLQPEVLQSIGIPDEEIGRFETYRGEGCAQCNGRGMRGRLAIYETMTMTDTLRDAILKGATTIEVKQAAIRGGMRTLRQAAIQKLKDGVTTIDEVLGKTVPDDIV